MLPHDKQQATRICQNLFLRKFTSYNASVRKSIYEKNAYILLYLSNTGFLKNVNIFQLYLTISVIKQSLRKGEKPS